MAVKSSKIKSTKSNLRIAARTSGKRMHRVPSKGGWSVKKEGAKRASGRYKTKDDAVSGAKSYKQYDGAIIIHKKDGSKIIDVFRQKYFHQLPFDNEYFPLLRAIIFTVIYLGYKPKISETSDSGANRLIKLHSLISMSRFSIHDISRVELNDKKLPRFNMPLECGIDFGAKMFGSSQKQSKSFLILEKEKFRYQQFMSDIDGNDIPSNDR